MLTRFTVAYAPATMEIPAQGFYFEMQYMHGDADGYATRVVGPFPVDREDLVLEFANVCQGMVGLYPDGKGGWDGYEDVPKYEAYFNEDFERQEDDPDQDIRESVGAETEYTPDGSGCIASLTDWSCWYHDGVSPEKRTVTFS